MTAPGLGAETALPATEKRTAEQQRGRPSSSKSPCSAFQEEACAGLMCLGDILKTSKVVPPKDLVLSPCGYTMQGTVKRLQNTPGLHCKPVRKELLVSTR